MARQRMFGWITTALMTATVTVAHARDVTTFHYDNQRTGWNKEETVLRPGNVSPSTFGKHWYARLDAQVYAAPLVVRGLSIGGGTREVVFAATQNNSVYALDFYTGEILWQNRLAQAVNQTQFSSGCPNINPLHGITSTPVIDRAKNVLYTVALVYANNRQSYRLYALDLSTGTVKPNYPVTIQGKDRTLTFQPLQNTQRSALTLLNGIVYIPFSSRCDIGEWHGWVAAVPVDSEIKTPRMFTPSLTTSGSGIWGTAGVSVDDNNNICFVTGNGGFNVPKGDNLGQSFIRLKLTPNSMTFTKQRADYFTPTNYEELNRYDLDMGGSSCIALPEHKGSLTPRLLVAGGKDGVVYLVNRDDMGGLGGGLSQVGTNFTIRTSPASFVDEQDRLWVYVTQEAGSNTTARPRGIGAYRVTLDPATRKSRLSNIIWTGQRALRFPGTPAVSSNGNKDAITWVIDTNKTDQHNDAGSAGILYAYNALSGLELYRSNATGISTRDAMGMARKFTAPIVANGRVFLSGGGIPSSTNFGVASYGLIPAKGDLYSDGKKDLTDVILILRGAIGLYPMTPLQKRISDFDGNAQVDIADAIGFLIEQVTTQ